jgi:phosphatidylglycerophosphatase A
MDKTRIANALSTFFYIGYFPVAPGSMASVAGACIAFWMAPLHVLLYAAVTVGITVIGLWSSGITEKSVGKKDPSCVVIDEVAGIMVSFFMVPLSWPVLVTGFFLFRAFDMFKIPPADRLEAEGGGKGIMMDDIAAGIYTNLTLQAGLWLAQNWH